MEGNLISARQLTATVLFAGGGGAECGLLAAGVKTLTRVEYDKDIAASNIVNFGAEGMIVGPVQDIDPRTLPRTDILWASPPCQAHSIARSSSLAKRDDADVGLYLLRFVKHMKPKIVLIENVPGYTKAISFKLIVSTLHKWGYGIHYDVYNAADYGVPQSRRRLILRAVLGENLHTVISQTHSKNGSEEGLFGQELPKWNGWYSAVEDLLPDMPESQFAPWQLKRLPEDMFGTQLVEGDAAGDRPPTCRMSDEPCMTLKTSSGGRVHRAFLARVAGEGSEIACAESIPSPCITTAHQPNKYRAFLLNSNISGDDGDNVRLRNIDGPAFTTTTASAGRTRAWLEQGRVVSMTVRALARFQTFPDWYVFPEKKTLASKIIGNAVPCLMAQRITESVLCYLKGDR